ncbi:MAG: PIN domain-containing protein [Gammaproteobacteria bacterium]|nr:PIN domain-containing protein [Gammaproteobacteria bacterium]
MNILFDTNIILDLLLNRKPFVELSTEVIGSVETGRIEGYLCATTITTLDYLLSKALNRKRARIEIKNLLSLFHIAEVNSSVVERALNSQFNDFEDAIQYYSATNCNVDGLVTRNNKDYKQTLLPIYTPSELRSLIALQNNPT